MNLQATQDNIVLKSIMASNITTGGVMLPGAKTFEDGAEVISVGPQVVDIAIGDIVVRPDPPRYTITDDNTGEILLICAEVDILAKVLPEESNVTKTNKKAEVEKEEATGKAGEVQSDRVPESRLDHLLPVHPVERLSEDNRDS